MERFIRYVALTIILTVTAALIASANPMMYLGTAGPVAVTGDTLIVGKGASLKALNLSDGGHVLWERSLYFAPDSLTISPNSEYVVACSREGGAALLFVSNGSEVADVRGTCPAIFSPDSSWLALGTVGGVWVYSVRGGEKEYYSIGLPTDIAWVGDALIVVGFSGGNGTAYVIKPLRDAEEVGPASGIAGTINEEVVVYSSSGLYFIGPEGVRDRIRLENVLMAETLSNGLVAASLINGSIVLANKSGIAWIASVFPGNRTYPIIDYATVIQDYIIIETRSTVMPEWAVIVINYATGETPIMEVANGTQLHAYPGEDGYLLITKGVSEAVLYRLSTEGVKEIARMEAGGRGLWCGTRLIISEPKPKLVTVNGDEASATDLPIMGEPIRWFAGCSLLLTSEPLTSTSFMLRVYDTSTWEEIEKAEVSLHVVLIGGDAIIKEVAENAYLIIFPYLRGAPMPEHTLLLVTMSTGTQANANESIIKLAIISIILIIAIIFVYKIKHRR